jgi:hypothetical protein
LAGAIVGREAQRTPRLKMIPTFRPVAMTTWLLVAAAPLRSFVVTETAATLPLDRCLGS